MPSVITTSSWNPPSWSLSNEAFFYLLFPLLLVAMVHLAKRAPRVTIGVCFLAFALLPVPLIFVGTLHGRAAPWWLAYVIINNPV